MIVKSREDWEKLVARGRQQFLLQNGVLRRGLPLGRRSARGRGECQERDGSKRAAGGRAHGGRW